MTDSGSSQEEQEGQEGGAREKEPCCQARVEEPNVDSKEEVELQELKEQQEQHLEGLQVRHLGSPNQKEQLHRKHVFEEQLCGKQLYKKQLNGEQLQEEQQPEEELVSSAHTGELRKRIRGEEKEEQNGKEGKGQTEVQALRPQLVKFKEMPAHLRFNRFVLGHYRPPMGITGCLASLTYFHNETINILTHAVPVLLILASVPWMLPWDKISVPWLPSIHVFACLAPWIGSTFYHLFMCHHFGQVAYQALLRLDLLGIWFTQTFGALVTIAAATHCFQYQTKFYLLVCYSLLCFLCLYQAMTVSTVWGRRFAFSAPFVIRMCCLILRLSAWGGGHPNSTLYVILQDLLAILGGYIGAVNIPEKWFPGKCDRFCNSHNIMHVLVVMAVYQMHQAASLDLVWMSSSSSCSGVPALF